MSWDRFSCWREDQSQKRENRCEIWLGTEGVFSPRLALKVPDIQDLWQNIGGTWEKGRLTCCAGGGTPPPGWLGWPTVSSRVRRAGLVRAKRRPDTPDTLVALGAANKQTNKSGTILKSTISNLVTKPAMIWFYLVHHLTQRQHLDLQFQITQVKKNPEKVDTREITKFCKWPFWEMRDA